MSNDGKWSECHLDGSEYEDTIAMHGRPAPPIPRKPVLLTTALGKQQGSSVESNNAVLSDSAVHRPGNLLDDTPDTKISWKPLLPQ